jgi:hypothetical protein
MLAHGALASFGEIRLRQPGAAAAESDFPRNAGASGLACDWDGKCVALTSIQLHPPSRDNQQVILSRQTVHDGLPTAEEGRQATSPFPRVWECDTVRPCGNTACVYHVNVLSVQKVASLPR